MMKQSKGLSLLLILALILGLCTSCSSTASTPSTVRIGVSLYLQDDTFISTFVQNLEQLAQVEQEDWGVNITLSISDAKENQYTQNDQIDRFISLDYDIICVNIVDRTAAAVLIDKAKEADIPIIFFNREPVQEDLDRWEHAYYVGSDGAMGGSLQGEIICDSWLKDSSTIDRNGDGILQYVLLEGEAGHQDALLRTEAAINTLTTGGITTQRLATDIANWQRGQAKVSMAGWIETFGSEIEVVISNNDDMALGAIDAYLAADISPEDMPFVVGVDAIPDALESMAAGLLDGTVRNDSVNQAQAVLDLALPLVFYQSPGEDIALVDDTYVWIPYTAIYA